MQRPRARHGCRCPQAGRADGAPLRGVLRLRCSCSPRAPHNTGEAKEVTQRGGGRAPIRRHLLRNSLPRILPSKAEASILSPGLAAGSASDLRAWQAVMMSCICRKLATASTSSTFSELRLSLAVYINSSTCPRPAKDTDSHHGPTSRPGPSSLSSCPTPWQDPGICEKQGGGGSPLSPHLPCQWRGGQPGDSQPRQQPPKCSTPIEGGGCECPP